MNNVFNSGFEADVLYDKTGYSSRILFAANKFEVFPSISPLCVGHVLLVPVAYFPSMAQVFRESPEDFHCLCNSTVGYLEKRYGKVAWFEHGTSAQGGTACGMSHAHLHFIPLEATVVSYIHAGLASFTLNEFATLEEAMSSIDRAQEYILFGATSQTFVIQGRSFPSQLIRRLIAEKLNLPKWDWRESFGWDKVAQTIAEYKEAQLCSY